MSERLVLQTESIPKVKTRDDLDDFLVDPVTSDEVATKADFIAKVEPWLSAALMVAGYPTEKLDGRLKEAFEGADFFTRKPDITANDVNGIITILFAEAASLSNEVVATSEPEAQQQLKNEVTTVAAKPAVGTLPLTNKMMVGKSAVALEEISGTEFSLDAYRDVTETADVAMNVNLEAVKAKVKEKLRRYSDTYVPKPSEKAALQLLPSLLAENARISVLRAQNSNNLEQLDALSNAEQTKQTARDFISALEHIQNTIGTLDMLIDKAEGEPNQPLTEAYRAQFEKLKIEGNKVLATLPQNHSRFIEFKDLIDGDLGDLITATSADPDGDKVVIEDHSTLSARRDRIKSAIAYMKVESDYLGFVSRTEPKITMLIRQLEGANGLSDDQMSLRQDKLDALRELTSKFNPQILLGTKLLSATAIEMFDEASKALASHKVDILNAFNESKTILESWPSISTQAPESPEQQFITEEELESRLAQAGLGSERWDLVRTLAYEYHTKEVIKRREALQAKGLGERLLNVMRQIPVRNVGKIAALAALFAVTPVKAERVAQSDSIGTTTSVNGVIPTTFPVFDVASVGENLRALHSTEIDTIAALEELQPRVSGVVPPLPGIVSSTEIVPGVMLPDSVSEITSFNTAPDFKIFSTNADSVPLDDVAFQKPPAYEVQLEPYLIKFADNLSDICKGLPFMEKLSLESKEKLILVLSKKLDSDASLRERLGIGSSDLIFEGKYLDREFLNLLLQNMAVEQSIFQ